MTQIVSKAKGLFYKTIENFGSDPYDFKTHLEEVEKWARYMLKRYPDADEEIVMLGVWLHDIGFYPIPCDIDHQVRGEERARKLLVEEKYPKERMERVLHCVRAHRCSDVQPETLEAKMIAFIDSASHFTYWVYFDIARSVKEGKRKNVSHLKGKIDRDLRELDLFPKEKKKLMGLYKAWKKLIEEYEKI